MRCCSGACSNAYNIIPSNDSHVAASHCTFDTRTTVHTLRLSHGSHQRTMPSAHACMPS
jgi:hypothetical protein